MIFINRTIVVFIVFSAGMGMGLRFDSEAETPKPIPIPTFTPDLKPCAKPEAKIRYRVPLPKKIADTRRIFTAITLWEHRGVIRPNDVSSAGAVGPAQIRQIYLDDSNEYAGTAYTLQDCVQTEIAYNVCCAYWARYKATTDEQRARIHFAGPRGMEKKCSLEYWHGVQSYL